MKTKQREIAKAELIGLTAEVIDSENKDNIGIKGKIVDETKNTIVIEHKNKEKRMFKNNIILCIKTQEGDVQIKGAELKGRAKERIK